MEILYPHAGSNKYPPPGFGKWSSCLMAQCPLLRVKIPLTGSVSHLWQDEPQRSCLSINDGNSEFVVDKCWYLAYIYIHIYIYVYIYIYIYTYIHIQNHHMVKSESPLHADPKGLAGSRGNSALRLCISSVAWSCPAGFLTSWEIPNRWMDSFMEKPMKMWMIPWFPYFRKLPFGYSIEHFHRFP